MLYFPKGKYELSIDPRDLKLNGIKNLGSYRLGLTSTKAVKMRLIKDMKEYDLLRTGGLASMFAEKKTC